MQHIIIDPNGVKHIINAPDDATPEQIMEMAPKLIPEDPNDALKSYGGGLERGAVATAMLLPNMINAAAAGPQELYQGLKDTYEGNPTNRNFQPWQPFYNSDEVLKMLPQGMQPHIPLTTGGKIADFSGQLMGGAGMGAVLSPKTVMMNQVKDSEQARLGKMLADNNVPVYMSDVMPEGSVAKGALETMGDLPFAGKTGRITAQQEGLNTAVAKQMGMDSNVINPPLMEQAANESGDVFKYLGDNYNISAPETEKLFDNLASYQGEMANPDPVAQAKINKQLGTLLSGVDKNGEIPGQTYSAVRSDLGRLARSASDPDVEMAAYGIQRQLDNAIQPSIEPEMQPVFAKNREYYRNMLAAEPAVKGAIKSGDITPTQLQQGVNRVYPNYIYNDPGGMPQLTQAAQLLNKGPTYGNSPLSNITKKFGIPGEITNAGLIAASPILGPFGRIANPALTPQDFNPKNLNILLGRALMAPSVATAAAGGGQ